MRITLALGALLILSACGGGGNHHPTYPPPVHLASYGSAATSPSLAAIKEPAVAVEPAPIQSAPPTNLEAYLSCDQLGGQLSTVARDIQRTMSYFHFYTGDPTPLQTAEYLIKVYEPYGLNKGLELNEEKNKDKKQDIELLSQEYKSLRKQIFDQNCPVQNAVADAWKWAKDEYNSGWRRSERFGQFIGDIKDIRKETKDW